MVAAVVPDMTPLVIHSVRARAVELPLPKPVETAAMTLTTAPLVLVDIQTEEGVVGCSYLSVYTPLALRPLATLISELGVRLRGRDAGPVAVDALLSQEFTLLGIPGLVRLALAALDMGLWDAQAKAAQLPLARFLGAESDAVEAYASLPSMDPRSAAADAGAALEQGFTAFKVKLGGADVGRDLAVIRAVRAVIGVDARLMGDYNQSLTVAEAIGRIGTLDPEGLYWIEEPTRADDYAGHSRIASAVATPIQLGESCWGPDDVGKAVSLRASSHLMFDAMKIGGVTGWIRAGRVAEQARLPVSSHVFPEISSHLLASTPTAHLLEYVDKVGPILTAPVRVRDGRVLITDRPGAGVEWDEAAVSRATAGTL